jgi:Flp pilus assembly secretin CpaC
VARRLQLSVLLLPALLLVGVRLWAQGGEVPSPPSPSSRDYAPGFLAEVEYRGLLSAQVGSGALVTLESGVERVALADDKMARIQVISPHEVLLTGLVPGRTTLHIWLDDGRRVRYSFQVVRDLDLVRRAIKDLDPRIEVEASTDGTSIMLQGLAPDEATSREAKRRAEAILASSAGGNASVLNLIRYPGSVSTIDELLEETLASVDPRIQVRRIQVGPEPNTASDTFVLEGRVRTVQDLVRAVMLAERQLGGTGTAVRALDDQRVSADRFRGAGGSGGFSDGGGGRNGQGLGGSDPRSSSLSSQLARGLVVTSESGRVISLMEVDSIPQVLVGIRVLEVDRGKARRVGFNFSLETDNLKIGSFTIPGSNSKATIDQAVSDGVINSGANIVGAFVDQTAQILAAVDFMTEKNLARSVAEPNIVTLSGELASILVGGEVPIPTTSANQVSTFSGVFFQDFGVRLDIRPTVTGGDLIAMEVAPSIVRVAPGLAVGGVPGFQVQSVTTTARVRAGQSMLIGGLLSFEDGIEQKRVPGLGALPLFRWKRNTRQERELLFLITPRLVDTEPVAQEEPVVTPPDASTLGLPELDWPRASRRFSAAEPGTVRPDGAPSHFVREEYRGYAPPPESAPVTFPVDSEGGYYPQDYPEDDTGDQGYVEYAEPDAEPAPDSQPMTEPSTPAQMVVIANPCLRMRPEPGPWSEPVDCIEQFTRVDVLENRGEWVRVRLLDGREGWMAGSYLAPVQDDAAAPGAVPAPGRAEPADDAVAAQIAQAEAGQTRLEDQLSRIRSELARIRTASGSGGGSQQH